MWPTVSIAPRPSQDYYRADWPKIRARRLRAERNWRRFVQAWKALTVIAALLGFLQMLGWGLAVLVTGSPIRSKPILACSSLSQGMRGAPTDDAPRQSVSSRGHDRSHLSQLLQD